VGHCRRRRAERRGRSETYPLRFASTSAMNVGKSTETARASQPTLSMLTLRRPRSTTAVPCGRVTFGYFQRMTISEMLSTMLRQVSAEIGGPACGRDIVARARSDIGA
jgi:hypothetical protein